MSGGEVTVLSKKSFWVSCGNTWFRFLSALHFVVHSRNDLGLDCPAWKGDNSLLTSTHTTRLTPNTRLSMSKYTQAKVPHTQDKHTQLSNFTQLHYHPIKSLAATSLPEYVDTHTHYWLASRTLKNSTLLNKRWRGLWYYGTSHPEQKNWEFRMQNMQLVYSIAPRCAELKILLINWILPRVVRADQV